MWLGTISTRFPFRGLLLVLWLGVVALVQGQLPVVPTSMCYVDEQGSCSLHPMYVMGKLKGDTSAAATWLAKQSAASIVCAGPTNQFDCDGTPGTYCLWNETNSTCTLAPADVFKDLSACSGTPATEIATCSALDKKQCNTQPLCTLKKLLGSNSRNCIPARFANLTNYLYIKKVRNARLAAAGQGDYHPGLLGCCPAYLSQLVASNCASLADDSSACSSSALCAMGPESEPTCVLSKKKLYSAWLTSTVGATLAKDQAVCEGKGNVKIELCATIPLPAGTKLPSAQDFALALKATLPNPSECPDDVDA